MKLMTAALLALTVLVGCKPRPSIADVAISSSSPTSAVSHGPQPPELIRGAEPARPLFCDTDMGSAFLFEGREVVSAVGDDFQHLIAVADGRPIAETSKWARGGRWWASVSSSGSAQALSLTNGSIVQMPVEADILRVAEQSPTRFWFTMRERDAGGWRFGRYDAGTLNIHTAATEPQDGVVLRDRLWTWTDTCALQSHTADGTVTCHDQTAPSIRGGITVVSEDHLLYIGVGSTRGSALFDVRSMTPVDVCDGALQLVARVAEHPALLLRCGESVTYWTSEGGTEPAEAPPSYMLLDNIPRFLPLGGRRYYDAVDKLVVVSDSPLTRHSVEGYGISGGQVVDWKNKRSRPYESVDCGFLGGGHHEQFGHWQYESCYSEPSSDELRKQRDRRPTITSCRSPQAVPPRLVSQRLVDLRDGTIHPIVDMKFVGLTEHGVVGVRGSGNDLVENATGVQIVLQPYPAPGPPKTDWTTISVIDPDTEPATVSLDDYEEAVFEWTCIARSTLPPEEKNLLIEKITAHYGLALSDFSGFTQTRRLNPRQKLQIRDRAEDCDDEQARSFGER